MVIVYDLIPLFDKMAKFLNGSGVQAALTDIITHTRKELCIVSPYLKIPMQTKNYLKGIDKKNIPITIVFRTDFSLNDDDLTFFNDLNTLELLHCDDLHSKCYINEEEGLITSMNLHEHSQTHNWEMGVKFSKKDDFEIYTDVELELSLLLSISHPQDLKQKHRESVPQTSFSKSSKRVVRKPTEAPSKGMLGKLLDTVLGVEAYCIRCGARMEKYDLNRPLCSVCYPVWAKFRDTKYREKYCHACGQQVSKISYEKPICQNCYNRLYM